MVHPAFLFDLDGTILDTLADLGGACNTVLANHGWPEHPLADYRQFVGNGFKRLVERALPQRITLGLSVAEKTACISEAWEHYASHLLCQTRPYPGIPEVLKELASQGYSLAVLSNKPDPMTQTLVGHFFPVFLPLSMAAGKTFRSSLIRLLYLARLPNSEVPQNLRSI